MKIRLLYRFFHFASLGALLAGLGGCGNMKKQESARTDAPSPHFPNGTTAQLPPAHTVARHHAELLTSQPPGEIEKITEFPRRLTFQTLRRGQERFEIYCAVCHGPDGYGRGIVVRRGFPAPPSLHQERLWQASIGHFFNVMTRGYGLMYAYADRLDEEDRWAVAAYVRALQRSQRGTLADVPPAERGKLDTP